MKKAVWLLSMVGLASSYTNAASANEGRIYLSSGDRQINMTYQAAPTHTISEDELNEAINRLTANAQAAENRAFATAQNYYNTANTQTIQSIQSVGTLDASAAPSIAARVASGAALSRSIGRCALYVRRALQAAGYNFTPQVSAYMYANGTLASAGFVRLNNDNYTPQVGDVAVFNRTSRNPHGHIQIYDGTQWVSDFVQPKFSPYSQHNGYSVWRDARYVNATQGTYLALND